MDSDAHACPACGQPVDTVVRRHKTLGAWVPVWVPGPCRNPKCEAYVDKAAEEAAADDKHRTPVTKTPVTNTATDTADTKKT
ncbi:hypothetical protein OG252_18310 [Streptomyces sp. NBC_01352]|uniref:Uncharacterized protein n=1 Tax=Streptomyces plumbiresistens TaxID=511811 RepID=A0ABP7Q5A1_9ACTN|nr:MULTISPECIES: hypothetical protein [unclassified Streptomyces]MCX4697978.1 hypothetical protein [Streptomyces sp. NBC_01373]